MQNLLKYIGTLSSFNSKSGFGYTVSAANNPTIFLKSYNLPKTSYGKDGPELVRFAQGEKIGKIQKFQWFGDKLMVFVLFNKPVIQPGFSNSVAAWIDPAFLNVELPVSKPVVSNIKTYYSTGNGVNFRSGPSTSNKELGKLNKGDEIGESDGQLSNVVSGKGWLKFTHPRFGVGYVRQDYTSTTQPNLGGSVIPKPKETGKPESTLPVQNPFSGPSATSSVDNTQKYIIGGIAIVVVGFITYLVINANQTKKLFKQLGNGIKRK